MAIQIEELIKIILGILVFIAVVVGVYFFFKNYVIFFFENMFGGEPAQFVLGLIA